MSFSLKGVLSLDTSGFSSGIAKANSGMDGLAGKAGKATSSVAGIATGAAAFVGLSLGVKDTFDTFTSFEKKMSNVQAISGASGDELKGLTAKAREMGKLLPASASEAADAEGKLASAGFETNEIMDSLYGTLTLAQSAQVDMGTAADITASTLRGFGLEASQATHVADVLALTASKTNAEIVDTGEAMKYVAPVARSAGTSLEETAAMIGLLANAGIKGSQAGTTLRAAFVRFQKPARSARDVMHEIGLKAYDSAGQMKDMATIIGEFKDKTANMTSEQRDYAVATVFGTEALSGMKVLMDAGKPAIDELTESFKAADGASADMAATQTANVYGAMENMKGAFEDAQIELVANFSPAIQQAFNGIADGLPGVVNNVMYLGSVLSNNRGIVLGLIGTYAAYRAGVMLSMGLELAHAGAIAAKNVILDIATAATLGYETVQGGASVATGVWTAATLVLNTVLAANPIGLVVVAVAGLIAIVVAAYNHFESFRNIVDGAWASLKRFIGIKSEADSAADASSETAAADSAGSSYADSEPVGESSSYAGEGNANGTSYFTGGASLVNERGGEMQILPSGISIIPADRTRDMVENNGGGKQITNYFQIDARGMDADQLVTQLQLRLANI